MATGTRIPGARRDVSVIFVCHGPSCSHQCYTTGECPGNSSADAHCGAASPAATLEMNSWQLHWSHSAWREYLVAQGSEAGKAATRQPRTPAGRPGHPNSAFIKL